MSKAALTDQLKWWEEGLQGVDPLDLPTDFPRKASQKGEAEMLGFQINKEQTTQLKALSLKQAPPCL